MSSLSNNRFKKDKLMLSASLIALVGTSYVVLSFAATPADTTKPGTIYAENLDVRHDAAQASVRISTVPGLRYCLVPRKAIPTKGRVTSDKTSVTDLYINKEGKVCYTADNAEKVTMTIQGPNIQPDRLEITK